MIPNDFFLLNIHHIGDIFMPFLPGNFINTHISRNRYEIQFFQGKPLQYPPIYPINRLIVQSQIPPGFLISGNGGQPVDLIDKYEERLKVMDIMEIIDLVLN